jgi:UDP-galactopyranose mutase
LPFVGRDFHKIVLPNEHVFPKDVYFVYYPGEEEKHTRVVEYKKFSQHKSPNSLVVAEVPSNNGRYYPMIQKDAIDLAQRYLNDLPENIISVGRAGLYKYMDMSEITIEGLEFQKTL